MEVIAEPKAWGLGAWPAEDHDSKMKQKDGEDDQSPNKSASQIMREQYGRAAPGVRKGISRRVYPIVSLNPYEGNWTIKVRVTTKGTMRTFTNARGQGNLFNVELTDKEGTQIQATMFKEAADKFYDKLQLGKLYYISKGSLRAANKRFSSINNDYEMTLHQTSEVEEIEEVEGAPSQIPFVKYNFVKIDELGPYINGRTLVDVVGVVQSVGSNTSIRRKSNNEEIPKRELTIADQGGKSVVISIWNDLATDQGSKILDMVDEAPVVALRAVRVSDYQGVSLSTTMKSTLLINPSDIAEAQALRVWYDEDGKTTTFAPAGANLPNSMSATARQSSTAERAHLCDITQPEVGEGKPAWFTLRACISFIKPEQAMWYLACTLCNRKVTQESSTTFWCEGCQKNYETCNRRYIMVAKVSDYSGEGWVSAFNEQAEQILGYSAQRLSEMKAEDSEGKVYAGVLKRASWVPRMLSLSVAQTEYMGEKRQRITVKTVGPVDWASECKLLLEKIGVAMG